jgi:GNAT superfamily N-acetyltransferase
MSQELSIAVAEAGSAADTEFVGEVTRLVNDVYAVGEEGLWLAGTDRTDPGEVAAIIAAGELAVARLDGKLAGVTRVQVLPTGEGEFGMLAASFAHRNAGVGRELVAFAECWAAERGRTTMQLELLIPREWRHPVKEFLRAWYTRIGYRVVRTGDFAAAYPALEPRLATPCDFLVFHRAL